MSYAWSGGRDGCGGRRCGHRARACGRASGWAAERDTLSFSMCAEAGVSCCQEEVGSLVRGVASPSRSYRSALSGL